jgi:hypothetical protein
MVLYSLLQFSMRTLVSKSVVEINSTGTTEEYLVHLQVQERRRTKIVRIAGRNKGRPDNQGDIPVQAGRQEVFTRGPPSGS